MGTWGRFCFNCRLHLVPDASGPSDRSAVRVEYHFTPAEIARLERYRAAVQAGLYSG